MKGSGRITRAISCHAWSPDYSQIALSPNSDDVLIYETDTGDASGWKLLHTLPEHDSFVSGIDWSPSNTIVTCGHDRNAYVFSFDGKEWKPTLVIVRISRAATAVKWAPSGAKFAVTSAAKVVSVCHYEEDNNWWVSKLIRGHKSTVVALDWHPNSKFIVTGSTDCKARIISAFLSEVDKSSSDQWGSIYPQHEEFGEVLAEFSYSGSWVENVSWSPSGTKIAYVSHDSGLYVIDAKTGSAESEVLTPFLPFNSIKFINDTSIVVAGYDPNPVIFSNNGKGWQLVTKLDKESGEKTKAAAGAGFKGNITKFQDAASKGVKVGEAVADTELKTIHQNAVAELSLIKKGSTPIAVCTVGLDGRIQIWDLKDEAKKLGL